MTRRQRLRLIQGAAAVGAVVLHLGFLAVLRPQARLLDPSTIPGGAPPILVTLERLRPTPQASLAPALSAPRQPAAQQAGADRPFSRPPPQAAPAWQVQPVAPPGPGTPVVGGIRLDSTGRITVAPEVQGVLRRTTGCDYDGPLTRAEQDACHDRMAASRNAPPLGLTEDRSRDRQLAADARRREALREYREAPPPAGLFDDLRDMGGGDGPRE